MRTAVRLSPDEAGGGAQSRFGDLQSPRLRHSGVRGVPALVRARLQRPLVTIAVHVRQPYWTDPRAVVRLVERLRMGNNMEFDMETETLRCHTSLCIRYAVWMVSKGLLRPDRKYLHSVSWYSHGTITATTLKPTQPIHRLIQGERTRDTHLPPPPPPPVPSVLILSPPCSRQQKSRKIIGFGPKLEVGALTSGKPWIRHCH